ncbi:MAG: YciI family protein [Candidatus Baltobacteraceae bacterium]
MFLLLSRYCKPLDEVNRWLPEHREFLDRHYAAGNFIVSGPMEPREGGVILTTDISREEVDRIMRDDPFLREGVSEYQYVEFYATKRTEAFAAALEWRPR